MPPDTITTAPVRPWPVCTVMQADLGSTASIIDKTVIVIKLVLSYRKCSRVNKTIALVWPWPVCNYMQADQCHTTGIEDQLIIAAVILIVEIQMVILSVRPQPDCTTLQSSKPITTMTMNSSFLFWKHNKSAKILKIAAPKTVFDQHNKRYQHSALVSIVRNIIVDAFNGRNKFALTFFYSVVPTNHRCSNARNKTTRSRQRDVRSRTDSS